MTFHVGQPFRPSASRENEIEKMLRDYRAGRLEYKTKEKEPMPMGHMLAKNETGADLGLTQAASYYVDGGYSHGQGTSGQGKRDPRSGFVTLRAMENLTSKPVHPAPTQVFGGLAFTLEPIAANEMGRVAVSGLVEVGTNESYTFNATGNYLMPSAGYYWGEEGWGGFARVLSTNATTMLVDLSDRYPVAEYTLTGNYSPAGGGGIANAVVRTATNHSWASTVYDLHSIAAFQRGGSKGFCTWYGAQWVVTNPLC
jgi:hypothetical protein